MKYGYARVSTAEQNLDRQLEALRNAGLEDTAIYTDKVSGVAKNRPAFDELMGTIKEGDSITVQSFDRLARSAMDLLSILETLQAKGVDLVSLKEACDTRTPQGKFFFTLSAAFAEMERALIKERQAEGIAIAKRDGRMTGRPKVDAAKLEAALELFGNGTVPVRKITEITGIGRSTIYAEAKKRGITRK